MTELERELMEALEKLADAFESRMSDWENAEFHECYNVARAALTKAKEKAGK